jgi:hypothetical protein
MVYTSLVNSVYNEWILPTVILSIKSHKEAFNPFQKLQQKKNLPVDDLLLEQDFVKIPFCDSGRIPEANLELRVGDEGQVKIMAFDSDQHRPAQQKLVSQI